MKTKYYHPYENPDGEKRDAYDSMVSVEDLPTFIVRLKRLLLSANWYDKAGNPSRIKENGEYRFYDHIFLMGEKDAYRGSIQFKVFKSWVSVKVMFTHDDMGLHFYSYLVQMTLGRVMMDTYLPFNLGNTGLNNAGFIKWMNNGEVEPFTREERYTELMEFIQDYTALDAMVDTV